VSHSDPEHGGHYRGPGWKQQGISAYERFLPKRAIYEIDDPSLDDYREGRRRIIADIPPHEELEGCFVEDTPIYAHYFIAGLDWYIATYDPDYDTCFGYTTLGDGGWDTFWLREVETLQVPTRIHMPNGAVCTVPGPQPECDLHWRPTRFGDIPLPPQG